MRRRLPALLAPLCLLAAGAADAPAQGRDRAPRDLFTPWADDARRGVPRDEHPRPQLRRTAWRSLNGRWRFGSGPRAGRDAERGGIRVPFAFQTPLSGINRPHEVRERVWYRRSFTVPERWRDGRVLLHFGAVDWEARVFVNGRLVGTHRGGYEPFALDVTAALRPGRARQTLTVLVRDPAYPSRGAFQPMGKQLDRGRIFYARTTGIWQGVWLEPVPATHLAGLRLRPDLGAGVLRAAATVARPSPGDVVRLTVRRGGRDVAAGEAAADASGAARIEVAVPDVQAWTPERPALYDVRAEVVRGRATVDAARSYTAFRSVTVRDGRVWLNGQPVILRGVLDQGYWPDGGLTAPADRALRHDLETTKRLGFNLARKHVKVEEARWYWHADRLGVLVAQDMPSSHNLRPPGAEANFLREWRAMLDSTDHFGSVVMWLAFNEDWGHPTAAFQSAVVDAARAFDPGRLVVDASGSVRRENSDLEDFHHYGDTPGRFASTRPLPRARWVGEYGGRYMRVPGHVWRERPPFSRRRIRSAETYLRDFAALTNQVNGAPGLAGYVFTQLTDVEGELNGLMTYDRLLKVPAQRVAAVNLAPPPAP